MWLGACYLGGPTETGAVLYEYEYCTLLLERYRYSYSYKSQFFVLGWVGGDTIDPLNILNRSCICPFALSVRSPDFTNFSPFVCSSVVCVSAYTGSRHITAMSPGTGGNC